MVLVGLGTYIIVFNLNNIVRTVGKQYKQVRSSVMKSMREDDSPIWKGTGDVFYRYELKASPQTTKPSEWWILLYQLRSIQRLLTYQWRSVWRISVGQIRSIWKLWKPDEPKSPVASPVAELQAVVAE